MSGEVFSVKAMDFTTAGDASAQIKRRLKLLGVDSMVLRRVAVCTYEAEINLVIHTLGGNVSYDIDGNYIVITATDIGPGIPDIDKAMTEGYSTASEYARNMGFGAGMGLPNMSRNADEFSISSEMGKGTVIEMRFRLA